MFFIQRATLFFFFFLLFSFSTVSLSHHFSPLDNYLLDCGSTSPLTTAATSSLSADHRLFSGDLARTPNSPFHSPSLRAAISLRNDNPFPGLSPIYHTARVFTSPASYTFSLKDKGPHIVRFHFHAFESPQLDVGRAQFRVLVDDYVVLTNFTRLNCTRQNPKVLEFLVPVEDEKIVIVFVPNRDSKLAFVNAIEVISAPNDLVPETARFIGSSGNLVNFDGLNKQALEVVHRVNVGGPKVTPFNDSLWRTWVPDDGLLRSSFGSERLVFGGRIKYHDGGASREVAPDNVYNSARLIRSENDSVTNVNMTWAFPILGGYKYLIRLHFCDIASISLNMLYFNVFVNGYLAYEDLDLSYITRSLASPFYADFVVDYGDGNVDGDLNVSIGPSKNSIPHAVDGILNGVEVMKINNSHGSFDGEDCSTIVLKSWSKGNYSGLLLTLAAAVCIVLSLSIVIRRKMIESRESLSWSRLPVNSSDGDDHVKVGNI